MKRLWILATIISGAIVNHSALSAAADSDPAAPAASAEAGAAKAAVCQACHGANGNSSNPQWPSLAGLGADYIVEQLKGFKSGKRSDPVMTAQAQQLDDKDLPNLGAYFDTLVNTGLEADPSYWRAGEKLYRAGDAARGIPACMACHGPTGRGNEPAKFPALRGQQSVYVIKQLNDYASGARKTGPNGIMQLISKRLTPEDMRNVASYIQGIR